MKMKWKISIIFIVILIGILRVSFIKVNSYKNGLETEIKYYLFTEKSYKNSEINDIKISYHFGRLAFGYNPYIISVVFSKEPETIYYYESAGKKIYQLGAGGKPINRKHEQE